MRYGPLTLGVIQVLGELSMGTQPTSMQRRVMTGLPVAGQDGNAPHQLWQLLLFTFQTSPGSHACPLVPASIYITRVERVEERWGIGEYVQTCVVRADRRVRRGRQARRRC